MTREEAIKAFEEIKLNAQTHLGKKYAAGCEGYYRDKIELADAALAALRGPTREMVEGMRGEWIIEDAGKGDRRKKCSLCDTPISGWWGRDKFCAECGAPMTDEAVEMVMERMEALHENRD